MAEYDLTQKLIPHLDRHLAIPLLAHLSDVAIFPAEQIAKAQYDLVAGTNMFDYIQQLHEQANAKDSPDFVKLRDEATAKYKSLQERAQPVMQVIEDPEAVTKLRSGSDRDKNVDMLKSEYNINLDQINALYHFGQYQYSLGDYAGAANFLYHFLLLSPSYDLNTSAHWGKLASNILSGEWDAALVEVKDLRDIIDNSAQPLAQLQARSWLLHWSLFVYFNLENGSLGLLDMFLSPAYLNTIQTSCPHLLRYLVAAAILSRSAPTAARRLKDLTRIVQMEEYQYSDPVTNFLKDLYLDFDFDKAQSRLAVAESVVRSDFFLSGFADEFVENARWLVSEVFCRIHQRIDIKDLSKTLNLSEAEGERWIVNLIRDSRMGVEAKIDLKSNMLYISRPLTTPTASLIETTRGLAFRSQAIQYALQSSSNAPGGAGAAAAAAGAGGAGAAGGAGQSRRRPVVA